MSCVSFAICMRRLIDRFQLVSERRMIFLKLLLVCFRALCGEHGLYPCCLIG
jgi:hypothetical protein